MTSYLLDTHTFLWFINDDPALSDTAKSVIEDPENTVLLSAASIWEMAIKVSLGKLELPTPFADFISTQLHENNFVLPHIQPEHTGIVAAMSFHHRDPFDRLIIAQSQRDDLTILGVDALFDAYKIKRLW
jgi:PIN domain nuclease of toxin-antitoxin system